MNIIRPSNAYCSGQLLHRVIPKAIVCGMTGQKLPLHGGGRAEKSYIHAKDLARAIYLVSKKAPLGEVYNAGPKKPHSIRAVVETVADVMKIPFTNLCEVTEDRLGQDSCYWLDSNKIKNHVGWEAEIPLDKGVEDVYGWCKKYIDALKNCSLDYTLRA